MPYGIKEETPEQTAWMEKCISSITGVNKRTGKKYTESEKIAICKFNLKKHGWKVPKEAGSELSIEQEINELEKKIRDAIGPSPDVVPSSVWVTDVFDDYVIVYKGDKLYKVNWSMSGNEVSVDWNSAVEVERKIVYEPVSAERKIITRVPNVKRKYRRITYGSDTID